LSKEEKDGEPEYDIFDNKGLNAVGEISVPPFVMEHSFHVNGRDVNLGPELDKDEALNASDSDKQEDYYKETYFVVVAESERIEGGEYKRPRIGACRVDNKDLESLEGLEILWHEVVEDGSLLPTGGTPKNSGEVVKLGAGNLVISNKWHKPGFYESLNLDFIEQSLVGKRQDSKKYETKDLKKVKFEKLSGGATSQFHKVRAVFKGASKLIADFRYVEIKYSIDPEEEGLKTIFTRFSARSLKSDDLESVLVSSSEKQMPFDDNNKDQRLTYDLGFELSHKMELEFIFHINLPQEEFEDKRIWSEESDLSNIIESIEFYVLYPGKCGEVIKIEPEKMIVSAGEKSATGGTKYNFFDEFKFDWITCQFNEGYYFDVNLCSKDGHGYVWNFYNIPEVIYSKYHPK